jgi:hypothetical protein
MILRQLDVQAKPGVLLRPRVQLETAGLEIVIGAIAGAMISRGCLRSTSATASSASRTAHAESSKSVRAAAGSVVMPTRQPFSSSSGEPNWPASKTSSVGGGLFEA